jgi:3-hydroxyisobutyrate dehydrogenase-like beta-hydroxyacid dehydrogenase
MASPTIAIIAAGGMGAPVGRKFVDAGLTVLTHLDGRSASTRSRAQAAGLQDVSIDQIVDSADWVLSILPPGEAYNFAETLRDAYARKASSRVLTFVDCNAVSPESVRRIAALFLGTSIKFVDAGIIGFPPDGDYNPTIYASSAPADESVLDEFVALSRYGLIIKALKGEGANVGDASALKMSYAVSCPDDFSRYTRLISLQGIAKGMVGVYSTMILGNETTHPD